VIQGNGAFRAWAVVPAKSFRRAKGRLAGVLGVAERRVLARAMFERVLATCVAAPELEGTLVATDGEDVARLAWTRGATILRDDVAASARLNAVIDAALVVLEARGATHARVVMADLPLLAPRDLAELLAQLRAHDLVIAPDQQRRGTSALGLRLGRGLRTCFGHADSLHRHVQEAARVGGTSHVLQNPRLAFDLDSPEDLRRWRAASSSFAYELGESAAAQRGALNIEPTPTAAATTLARDGAAPRRRVAWLAR
jgi:2-phospho-L-lactate guanylyltransferase